MKRHPFFQLGLVVIFQTARRRRAAAEAVAAHAHERRPAIFFVAIFNKRPVDRLGDGARRRAGLARRPCPSPSLCAVSRTFRAPPAAARPTPWYGRSARTTADARRDLADDDIARLDDAIGGRMERLIVIVRHHHAEIIFGAERTHAYTRRWRRAHILSSRAARPRARR